MWGEREKWSEGFLPDNGGLITVSKASPLFPVGQSCYFVRCHRQSAALFSRTSAQHCSVSGANAEKHIPWESVCSWILFTDIMIPVHLHAACRNVWGGRKNLIFISGPPSLFFLTKPTVQLRGVESCEERQSGEYRNTIYESLREGGTLIFHRA